MLQSNWKSKNLIFMKTEKYSDWKSWGSSNFGHTDSLQWTYYDEELSIALKGIKHLKLTVLEIGFGNGSFLNYARRKEWEIEGTEISEKLIELARNQNYNVHLISTLDVLENNKYDLIVAFDVIEHIKSDNIINFFEEVGRILKPGGIVVARFPNGDSPFGLVNQNGDITHVQCIGSGKARYIALTSEMDILYLGSPAEPIFCGSVIHFFHRLISKPVKFICNIFVKLIYFPRSKINFMSSNLTMILKKRDVLKNH